MVARIVMAALLAAATPAVAASLHTDPDRIRTQAHILAGDDFEGREPGTRAEGKTIAYLAEAFRKAGLQPAGELIDGGRSWFQRVPVVRSELLGPVRFDVQTPAGVQKWERSREFAIQSSLILDGPQQLAEVPLVFVGHAVHAPDRQWDDFKGIDLTGKIAIALMNDPDVEGGTDFDGPAVTQYGRATHKIAEVTKRGAIGIVFVHQAKILGYGWPTTANSAEQKRFALVPAPDAPRPRLEAWFEEGPTRALFTAGGQDYDALRQLAATRAFRPVELGGVTLTADYRASVQQIESRHVLAAIPGTSRPGEVIITGAHWDHIGIGKPDAKGDRIYNGAWDNAVAVGALLEIARTLARQPPAPRTQLFIAWTLEEPGLVGSEYYARNPLYPLERTVAVLNMDGLFPMGRSREFGQHAHQDSTLNDLFVSFGERQGRRHRASFYPEMALGMRSDHWPLARRGVPPISIATGEDLVDGGLEKGAAYVRGYLNTHYHHQSDNFDPAWRFDGVAEDADLLAAVSDSLARSADWPVWKEGSAFKALRDQSADWRR